SAYLTHHGIQPLRRTRQGLREGSPQRAEVSNSGVQRAGELDTHRKELLDEEGMVWEPGRDEAWEAKLAALRSFRRGRRHRITLEQRNALTELGMEWA
ncbi:hypothetical protein ABZY11_19400, partial [Streptomyces sp. NPDC006510]